MTQESSVGEELFGGRKGLKGRGDFWKKNAQWREKETRGEISSSYKTKKVNM